VDVADDGPLHAFCTPSRAVAGATSVGTCTFETVA
jgi:hypothetical protein